jgi:hypothetical protein
MLTEEQRVLFREILDLNWDFSQETDWNVKFDLARKLNQKKRDLKRSMGEKEYEEFISMGRKMFAPREEAVEEN